MKTTTHSKSGFTLIEVMFVVVIIGVITTLMVPAFTRYMRNTRAAAFTADIKTLAAAGNQYALESGYWVEDVGSGIYPTELEGYFSQQKFELGTPLGGVWDFENWDLGDFTSAVGVDGPTEGDDVFVLVDSKLDDGNLATGVFQKLADDRYYYGI